MEYIYGTQFLTYTRHDYAPIDCLVHTYTHAQLRTATSTVKRLNSSLLSPICGHKSLPIKAFHFGVLQFLHYFLLMSALIDDINITHQHAESVMTGGSDLDEQVSEGKEIKQQTTHSPPKWSHIQSGFGRLWKDLEGSVRINAPKRS